MSGIRWDRRAIWIAMLIPFAALALLRIPEGPRIDEGDYAHYLLHAQALAEGRDYRDTGFIPTRYNWYIGPPNAPPGLPAVLAPIVWLGGVRTVMIPLTMVAFALAFAALAARYFAEREAAPLAIAVGLMVGLQPDVQHFASQSISDLPFAALVWGVVLLCDRAGPWSWRRTALITGLGAAAIAFRLAGIALIPALAAFALLQFRSLRWRPLIPLIAWIVAFRLTSALVSTTDAMLPVVASVAAGSSNLLNNVSRVLPTVGYSILDAQLYPFPWDIANQLYHLVTLFLLAVGVVAAARRYWRSYLAILTGSYVSMLMLVPVNNLRYWWVLIPLYLVLTLNGAVIVLQRLWRSCPAAKASKAVAGAAVGLSTLAVLVNWTPPVPTGVMTHPDVKALYGQFRTLTPAPRVLVFRPRTAVLETGVPAMALFHGSPDVIMRELLAKRITHVVAGDLGRFPVETGELFATLATYPTAFSAVYRNPSFRLLRFDSTAASAALVESHRR